MKNDGISIEKNKELIRLFDDVRELFPELLLVLGSIDQLHPASPLRERIQSLRMKIEMWRERARRLEEATDCMPAADAGRQQSSRG